MQRHHLIAATLMAAIALSQAARADAPDWSGFDWLLGQWTAQGGGTEQGKGSFTFSKEAGGQVLVRRNFADYPAQNGNPASRHDDLMVIYHDGSVARADYWDSEGHTIHYSASSLAPDIVTFVSDDPTGPRFRLTYRRSSDGLDGKFEIAPPTDGDHFSDYLVWKAHRAP